MIHFQIFGLKSLNFLQMSENGLLSFPMVIRLSLEPDKRIKWRFPSKALPLFVSAVEELENLIVESAEIVDELKTGESYALDAEPIRALVDRGESIISDIGWELAILTEGMDGNPGLEPDTRAKKNSAERSEREGRSFIQMTRRCRLLPVWRE